MKKLFLLFLCIFTIDSFGSGIGDVATAPCDNATLSKYTGTANVEINWEPNTIGLKWFNGDQQIAGQTSCTYNGTITVPPAPTKPGYTFNGWKVQKVTPPDGYTQLEYLESTGTQCINTGITGQYGMSFEITLAFTTQSLGYQMNGWCDDIQTGIDSESYWWNYGRGWRTTTINQKYKTKLVITSSTGDLYVDEELEKSKSLSSNYNRYNFYLFSAHCNEFFSNEKIYDCKIKDADGELLRNFIPARRNSDNELGLFDTVSGRFFTNDCSGTFTAGPNAQ